MKLIPMNTLKITTDLNVFAKDSRGYIYNTPAQIKPGNLWLVFTSRIVYLSDALTEVRQQETIFNRLCDLRLEGLMWRVKAYTIQPDEDKDE